MTDSRTFGGSNPSQESMKTRLIHVILAGIEPFDFREEPACSPSANR